MKTRDEVIRGMAEILAGLQVPVSLDPRLLGAAAEPWRDLFGDLNSFGWTDADALEAKLKDRLGEKGS